MHLRAAHAHLEERGAARDGVDRLPLADDPARLAEHARRRPTSRPDSASHWLPSREPASSSAVSTSVTAPRVEAVAPRARRRAKTIAATAPFMSPEPTPWSSPSSTVAPYGSRRHSARSPGGFVSRWPPRISVRPPAPPACASRFGRSSRDAGRLDPRRRRARAASASTSAATARSSPGGFGLGVATSSRANSTSSSRRARR